MVLEEASDPNPNSSVLDSYSSDDDPYASSSSTAAPGRNQITIRGRDLPRPVPVLGPLLGYTNDWMAREVSTSVAGLAHVVRRPLTPEEANSIAYHVAKAKSITSWGVAAGVVGGAYRAYSTADTWRFPFFKPDLEKLNPDIFGTLKGQAARRAWHAARGSSYIALGWILGLTLGNNLGAFLAATGAAQDPRLQAFSADLNTQLKKNGLPLGRQMGGRQSGATEKSAPNQRSVAGPRDSEDDMSPTSDPLYSSTEFDSPVGEDQRQYGNAFGSREGSDQTTGRSRWGSQYDDASPTGGLGPMAPDSSGESAWDRIRKQATSQDPGSCYPHSAGNDRPGLDSFAFSERDEDRQLAKSEAQREFDARVDRERNGGDFEDRGKR